LEDYDIQKSLNFFDQLSLASFHEIIARLVLKQTSNLNKSQLRILDNECLFDPVISNSFKY
jgi:hypothetical protein